MNEFANSLNGDCISSLPPPPSYDRQLTSNPSFWNPQMSFNNNGANNTQINQQIFDTPTTSQNANFDINIQQQFPQFNTEGRSIPSPYFIPQHQQQLKQFQDSQRKNGMLGGGGGGNVFSQEFQRPESNFSSGQLLGNEQIQQKIQQQISSPSVSSTADLLASNGGQGNMQQNFLPQQQQLCFQQMQPNGMFDPQSNNSSIDINNTGNFMNGNCSNSPMFRQSLQMNNNGQQSIPSPLIGQQHPQMIQQPNNPSMWQGMPSQMLRMPPPNGLCPQQIRGNNGSELEPSPFPFIPPTNGMLPPPPLLGRFVFNSEMLNKAAIDVKMRQVPDLPHWHLQALADWHMANPSTSKAFYSSQMYQIQQQQQLPIRINEKSPHSLPPSTSSRSNKRKASTQNSTLQEQQQQNSSFSPLSNSPQINNNNFRGVPPCSINNNQINIQNNNNNVGGSLQRYGLKDVVCDSSTNNSVSDLMFKRPSEIINENNTIGIQQQRQTGDFYSLQGGQQLQQQQQNNNNIDGTTIITRLDDENPLKKMEIMASKTLNEQPVNKMARLMGQEEENGGGNYNRLNNNNCQQQQQGDGEAERQEKMRKLQQMEFVLRSSCENNNNIFQQQQQFLQMQQNSAANFIPQNGMPPPPQPFPPHLDINNIDMSGGGGQFKQQQPPFFQNNIISSQHFNNNPNFVSQQQQQMLIPQTPLNIHQKFNNQQQQQQQFDINNSTINNNNIKLQQ